MLTLLFSPSEGKNFTHTDKKLSCIGGMSIRQEILDTYNNIVLSKDISKITKLFGLKKEKEIQQYICNIFTSPTTKAILRYNGVAYDYLSYSTLPQEAKQYLDTHMYIFSNLFGIVKADDLIPLYKVKQGNSIGTIKPEEFYKKQLQPFLDSLLKESEILDLRAGYYDKFYKITQPYTTIKFLKNNKVISHWAKAYRGIVAREIALHNIQSINEFIKLPLPHLQIEEIKQIKNKTEIIYKILD